MSAQIIQFTGSAIRASWAESGEPLSEYQRQVLIVARMMIERGMGCGTSLAEMKRNIARGPDPSEDAVADSIMIDVAVEMAAEVERRIRSERLSSSLPSRVVTFQRKQS